jgi:MSHA biogenesis protein MshI
MRWPWRRAASGAQLIVSWSGQTLAYVVAEGSGRDFTVKRAGVEVQGSDTMEEFVRRLTALGLKGRAAHVMLKPEQYQVLQIEAPSVPPEELRSAARYQVKEMVDAHLDDLTMDVLRVGDGEGRAASQMFVVAANNSFVRDVMGLGEAMHWDVRVIDVQDMAQRNLQTLLEPARATGALLLSGGRQALLTISAAGELFYSRRLDLPEGFMGMTWTAAAAPEPAAVDTYTPVEEYVPDYAGGGSYSPNFSTTGADSAPAEQGDIDRAQRLLVEVQRSIDLWERTWTQWPLAGFQVFAGERSAELAEWLSRDTGQNVSALEVASSFAGWDTVAESDRPLCLPLLGVLLRGDA